MIDLKKFKNRHTIKDLFNSIAHRYDRVNRLLSFSLDRHWRRSVAKYLPKKNALRVLDLATGTAEQILALSDQPRIHDFIGLDISNRMLEIGKQKIEEKKLQQPVFLLLGNALEIPKENDSVDIVTMSFGLRNTGNTKLCLQEMHRVLKTGGKALILEFSHPSLWIRPLYSLYLGHILPKIGGWISHNEIAYRYLHVSIEEFFQQQELLNLILNVGFKEVRAHRKSFGIVTIYEAIK